jgi:hypothetical protein
MEVLLNLKLLTLFTPLTPQEKEKKKVRKRNAIAQLNISLFELSFLDEMISEPFVVYKLVRFYLVDTELLFKVCASVDCQ